jgi:mono/diheme cytochrome c family protein
MRRAILTAVAAVTPAACHHGSAPSAAIEPALPFSQAQVASGDSLFHNTSCWRCHGADAQGTVNGPTLRGAMFRHITGSYEDIVHIVTTGIPRTEVIDPTHKLEMRPRGGLALADDQIRAIAAYVYTISRR